MNDIEHRNLYGIHHTTIDRIDNLGHYCKENCRWATHKIQCNNTSSNRIINYKGKQYTVSQLSDYLGVKYKTLYSRLHNKNFIYDDKDIDELI